MMIESEYTNNRIEIKLASLCVLQGMALHYLWRCLMPHVLCYVSPEEESFL